ncbi:MAG: hypothetical protein QNJ32_14520 [Xenococcaceae cyanobacterium MO_167.B27]|nr:hypothetical protein [Xenococcaceae cyanobacterium MO_167.B27]
MEVIEIKFLLKLLADKNHRTTISNIRLGTSIQASVRNNVCRRLYDLRLVQFTEKIAKIRITAKGKTALNKNAEQLTQLHLKVLKACLKKGIPPSGTRISSAQGREIIISELVALGLITVLTKIHEVWLTAPGEEYLAILYKPTGGGNINLSKKMLADYLEFLRGYFSTAQPEEQVTPAAQEELSANENVDDNMIYQAIADLDESHKTDNYLPIFYLRNQFRSLSREKLDQALYRLQAANKIDFSTLAEVEAYTTEQIDAGISQVVGGRLFYICRATA